MDHQVDTHPTPHLSSPVFEPHICGSPSQRCHNRDSDCTSSLASYHESVNTDRAILSNRTTSEPVDGDDEEYFEEDEEESDEDEEKPSDSISLSEFTSPSFAFPQSHDDISVELGTAPIRQVDYLSHEWNEPDLWSSWRYVRKEKARYPQNATRLENASWRSWGKSRHKLKTITPDTLNWLKDCDVTWLYGPFQSQWRKLWPAHANSTSSARSEPAPLQRTISHPPFAAPSNPILKKRSLSQMLTTPRPKFRVSIAVRETLPWKLKEEKLREERRKNSVTPSHELRNQQWNRSNGLTNISRASLKSPFPINHAVPSARSENTGNWPSSASNGDQHISFDDRVEQCIAVEVEYDEEDSTDSDDGVSEDEGLSMLSRHFEVEYDEEDSTDSDDGVSEDEGLSMRSRRFAPKPEHSTIAKLPATWLSPSDEPICKPPKVPFGFSTSHDDPKGFYDDLTEDSGFYDEKGGFCSSATPEFPSPHSLDQENPLEEFLFDHVFPSQCFSENVHIDSPPQSPQQSRDFGSMEERQIRVSVLALPIPAAKSSSSPKDCIKDEEDDDYEVLGVIGLAADAIATAKDLVGVLWNAGWNAGWGGGQ